MHTPASSALGAFVRRLLERRVPSTAADAEWLLSLFRHRFYPIAAPEGGDPYGACLTDAESTILYAYAMGYGLANVWSLVETAEDGVWLVSGVHPGGARGYLVTAIPWQQRIPGWLPVETRRTRV